LETLAMNTPHPTSSRVLAFDAAMAKARRRHRSGDAGTAFVLLERAHVLGQRNFGRHLRVHVAMLRVAWALNDRREIRGQLLRIFLTPLGHLSGRLPKGNTGASDVSAFAALPVSSELEQLLDDKAPTFRKELVD
jgi:hypothetical protein